MTIAFGGFQHETNTFAPSKAELADFQKPGAWPGLTRGEALFGAIEGVNIPIAGFVEKARGDGRSLAPLSWCNATPSAQVTEEAFETITAQILEDLARIKDLDALYLDLHGAMVTEHLQDGEGEILRRARDVVGPNLPIVVSLDLHANVTPEMVELADVLIAYRTYPHVDMAATGARCFKALARLLAGAPIAGRAFRQMPFLMPLTSGCTMLEPAKSLYARLGELERRGAVSASFNAGFAPADIHHCGPSVLVYAADQATADALADEYAGEIEGRELDFAVPLYAAEDAVAYATEATKTGGTVVVADTQDNPGAGANGDTTGLLKALVEADAPSATIGLLYDPDTVRAALAADEGAPLRRAVGAISGMAGHDPFEAPWRVSRLGDGVFTGTGPFYKGARFDIGPMARLTVGEVDLLVGSSKLQAADQEIFRHLGVEPAEKRIVVVKSSVHFRAHFQPIAKEVIIAASPGPNPVDNAKLDYRNLRPGVRVMPGGPVSG
jgi:microcystin degradation protein MlrC